MMLRKMRAADAEASRGSFALDNSKGKSKSKGESRGSSH
jgi:hypothetical protein